jgi:hypothetical protein
MYTIKTVSVSNIDIQNEHNYMNYPLVQIITGNNVAAKLLIKHTHWSVQTRLLAWRHVLTSTRTVMTIDS